MLRFVACAGLMAALAGPAAAGPVSFVDFREPAFAGANAQSSFEGVIPDGPGFEVFAFERTGSGEVARALFQDEQDGLGIRGGTANDEIDQQEGLRIEFAQTIGLTTLFFADLFFETGAGAGGEGASIFLDGVFFGTVTAATIDRDFIDPATGFSLNAANGEGAFELGGIIPLNTLTVFTHTANRGNEFAFLGFIDPPLEIVGPAALPLFGLGLGAAAMARRRRH
ncbi:MAG: hypothetical protein ACFB22_10490 [Rhodothalassiaceae bacterium]